MPLKNFHNIVETTPKEVIELVEQWMGNEDKNHHMTIIEAIAKLELAFSHNKELKKNGRITSKWV